MMGIVPAAADAFRTPDHGVEGRFYEELGPTLFGRVPHLLGRDGGDLLLERLPPGRPLDGWTPADLLSGARMLAVVHGRYWGLSALAEERPWLPVRPSASGLVALCHGDPRPGNVHMAEDGTKWIVSWGQVHLGDPVPDLHIYIAAARALAPRLSVPGLVDAYLDVLSDRMEVTVDPSLYLSS